MGRVLRLLSEPCHVTRLPTELLLQIASLVVESRDLFSLCCTCRTLHDIALPFLYAEIVLVSKEGLHALQCAPEHHFKHTRELNVLMEVALLDSFQCWALTVAGLESPFSDLVNVLRHTKNLVMLRLRACLSSGPVSAWQHTFMPQQDGIPFGDAFRRALIGLSYERRVCLPKLKTLELDTFSDIAPLLRLTPNLEHLRLETSSGYPQRNNAEVVDALRRVPHLKEFRYTPQSLRVRRTPILGLEAMVTNIVAEVFDEQDRSAELIHLVAKQLPQLKSLDLRRRWNIEQDVLIPLNEEPITPEALISAMNESQHLKNLALPTSVFSIEDHSILRSPSIARHTSSQGSSIITHFPLPSPSQMAARRFALQRTVSAEKAVADKLLLSYGVNKVTFTRPVLPTDCTEASVSYTALMGGGKSPRWTSSIAYNAQPVPQYPTYSRWWRFIVTKENDIACLFFATLCGIFLGEICRTYTKYA